MANRGKAAGKKVTASGKPSDSRAGKRRDRNKRVGAGGSNPCFEIWIYAYLGEMPVIMESYTCCDRFAEKFEKVTGQLHRCGW